MNGTLYNRAGGDDFGFLIFLVIAGIIQFIGWLKKKSIRPVEPDRPLPGGPSESEPRSASPEDELKRILEELTGRKPAPPPAGPASGPPPIPAPRPQPVSAPRPVPAGGPDVYERTHGRKALRWRLQQKREREQQAAAPPPLPAPAPASLRRPEPVAPPLPPVSSGNIKSALNSGIRMVSFKFPSLKLPTAGMMRTESSSHSTDMRRRRLPLDVRTMRKAVIYQALLGPPVALQGKRESGRI